MKSTRVQISVPASGDGLKTREAWIAEALGATWTHRRDYTVASASRAAQFAALCAVPDIEASRRCFASDREPYTFSHPRLGTLSLRDMLIAIAPART